MLTRNQENLRNVFTLSHNEFPKKWILNFESLKLLTNEKLATEIQEEFGIMNDDLEFEAESIKKDDYTYAIHMETVDYSVTWNYNSNDDTYTCIRFDQ
ncbi:TPA: hypothetical protein ACOQ31_004804 [Bacillus cereus]